MVSDDIPGVRGAPGGPGGRQGGTMGDYATPDAKMSDKIAK